MDTLDPTGAGPFPERLPDFTSRETGPDLIYADGQLFYLYDNMDRWPSAPASVHSLAVLIDRAWFEQHSGASLTPSEYQLVSLLLCGRDLRGAAGIAGASYDTKRKQLRRVMEKFGVHAQTALVRSVTLHISAYVLDAIIRPEQRNPETVLAQEVYVRGIVIHSVSNGGADDVPIWEFGARRGHPILFFHSMLAPIIFPPDMVRTLKALNLLVLMMLRQAPSDLATVDEAFAQLRLADWLRLIANTAVRASIDEVAHLQSNWVQDIFKLDLPMRFIHGDDDPLCPVADGQDMVAALPGVPFTRVPNAGHLILGRKS